MAGSPVQAADPPATPCSYPRCLRLPVVRRPCLNCQSTGGSHHLCQVAFEEAHGLDDDLRALCHGCCTVRAGLTASPATTQVSSCLACPGCGPSAPLPPSDGTVLASQVAARGDGGDEPGDGGDSSGDGGDEAWGGGDEARDDDNKVCFACVVLPLVP